MILFFICIFFYLIGSFPTAYILVRLKHKKILTQEGTGNIGARNTYDVTNSKVDGIVVFIVDFLKGLVPTFWFLKYSELDPRLILISSVFLLLGHNYSVWLKFKGGRGLSTATGIMVIVNFAVVILWLIFYFAAEKLINNVHIASVIALIILPVSIVFFKDLIMQFNNSSLPGVNNQFPFLFSFCSSICLIVLVKHISPVLKILKNKKIR